MSRRRTTSRREVSSSRVLSNSGRPATRSASRAPRLTGPTRARRWRSVDHLGGGVAEALVGERRERDGRVGRELLGQVETGDADLRRGRAVLDQDDLGAEQPVDDALVVGVGDRGGDLELRPARTHRTALAQSRGPVPTRHAATDRSARSLSRTLRGGRSGQRCRAPRSARATGTCQSSRVRAVRSEETRRDPQLDRTTPISLPNQRQT